MILFKKYHVAPIISGVKTQTRRLGAGRWKIGATHQAKINYYKSGCFALIQILEVHSERLGAISPEDALAEGYPTVEAYLAAFKEINKVKDPAYLDWVVWVVKFRLVTAV